MPACVQAGAKLERARLAGTRSARSAPGAGAGAGTCRQQERAPPLQLGWAPRAPAVAAA